MPEGQARIGRAAPYLDKTGMHNAPDPWTAAKEFAAQAWSDITRKVAVGEMEPVSRKQAGQLIMEKVVPQVMDFAGGMATLAGPKALNANLKGLDRAKSMLEAGVDAERIRKETNWLQGKYDKKWRFEIDDSTLNWKLNNLRRVGDSYFTPARIDKRVPQVGDIVDHPALFEQYPSLKSLNIDVDINPNKKMYGAGAPGGWYSDSARVSQRIPHLQITARTLDDAKKTLLHELQHYIQHEERFAAGGSYQSALKNYPDEVATLQQQGKSLVDAVHSVYERHAGEIESRDVSARANMTVRERMTTAPYSSENISAEAAFVRQPVSRFRPSSSMRYNTK